MANRLPKAILISWYPVQISGIHDDFFAKLTATNFAAVMFAPGACRYSAARPPIPGGNAKTKGWTLEEYRWAVRETLGDTVPIVETTEERQIVPLLREALGLPKLQ